jgi:hypothetical protein
MTMANAPLGDGTARLIEVIWVRRENKYFCKEGWTEKLPDSLPGKSLKPSS